MRIEKRINQDKVYDLKLIEDERTFSLLFGGNGDLYWTIYNSRRRREIDYESFLITKENYQVYSLFEQLYEDIKNIRIFEDESFPPYLSEEEHEQYKKEEQERYRKHNYANYKELFNGKEKKITWYSDETARAVANYVTVTKQDESFKLEFQTQPYIAGYDEEMNSCGTIVIRFRNSGSRYNPFNIIFMRMYNNMQEVEDSHEIGHQIHIEEYLYENKKPYQKRKEVLH